MKKTTFALWTLAVGAVLVVTSTPIESLLAQVGRSMSTGGLSRCRLVTLPTPEANNLSYGAVMYEEIVDNNGASIGAKFTIEPQDTDKIELGDLGGSYFLDPANAELDAPIEPPSNDPTDNNETYLLFTINTNQNTFTITGKLNGEDLQSTPAESIGTYDPFGQFHAPDLVDFGTRPGTSWKRERVVFEYFGVTSGFSLLDKVGP
jgi:hypothetical protein